MVDYATRGSQRWLQIAIERHPHVLLEVLREPLCLKPADTIDWRSPVRSTEFKEYRDGAALALLGQNLDRTPLSDFWPARGPVWDALGLASDGRPIFVEAKAHIAEAASPGTQASPDSLKLIIASLEKARKYYAPKATSAWTGTFYQYANRLAHNYLLRELNGIDSQLVFFYFLNATDVDGPASHERWKGAIELLHAALGLSTIRDKGVHEVFVDVRDLS